MTTLVNLQRTLNAYPRLSLPPIVSDCIPSAIERTSALDRPHTSPRHDAHSHERTRRGIAKAVRLTPNTLLPCREAKLHNARNKSLLNGILYGYPLQYNMQLVNKLDCIVTHAEANITLCSYMLHAAADRAQTIRILSDDTNVFVLLVY